MEYITVEKLYLYLLKEIQKGHNDYAIFVTDDEEANGYHTLWYLGQTAKELGLDRKYFEKNNCDLSILKNDTDKAIYLG